MTSKYYNAKDMGHAIASRFCRQTLTAKSYWEILNNNSYSLKDKFIHQVVHTSGSLRKGTKSKNLSFFWENFAKKRFIIGRDRLKRELTENISFNKITSKTCSHDSLCLSLSFVPIISTKIKLFEKLFILRTS